jgi:hypothetical protein
MRRRPVLVKPRARVADCAAGACVAPDASASVAGDVSIAYALETIAQRAPAFKADAELLLQRMQ